MDPHVFSALTLIGGGGSASCPACFTQRKESPIYTARGCVGTRTDLDILEHPAFTGNELRIPSYPTHFLVSTVTELPRLPTTKLGKSLRMDLVIAQRVKRNQKTTQK